MTNTLSTFSCATSRNASSGGAGITLTTPAGTPAWEHSSPMRSAESGVRSEGFRTTELPIARAAATWIKGLANGIGDGVTSAITPTAS